MRYRLADTPIDARPDGEEIEDKLLELEALAMENGASLGTGFAYPITIDILKAWTSQLEEKGIALAPVSAVTRSGRPAPKAVESADGQAARTGQGANESLNTAG